MSTESNITSRWPILAYLSIQKTKIGAFDGPQIRHLTKEERFNGSTSDFGRNTRLSFENIVMVLLASTRAENGIEIA